MLSGRTRRARDSKKRFNLKHWLDLLSHPGFVLWGSLFLSQYVSTIVRPIQVHLFFRFICMPSSPCLCMGQTLACLHTWCKVSAFRVGFEPQNCWGSCCGGAGGDPSRGSSGTSQPVLSPQCMFQTSGRCPGRRSPCAGSLGKAPLGWCTRE